MALQIFESRVCIICRKNHELINVPKTIVNNKVLFDACLKIFEIEEETYNPKYKWKWDPKLDLPNFCTNCGTKIGILSKCMEDLNAIKRKIDDIVRHTKLEILKSTSADKLNWYKRFPVHSLSESISRTDAIEYFRSVAVQDWNPTVLISSSDQNATEVIELVKSEQLILTEEEWNQYMEDIGGKFQCKVCSSIITNKRNTSRHINTFHRKINRFQCSYCLKTFFHKSKCIRHVKVRHKGESRRSDHSQTVVSTETKKNCVPDQLKCLVCLKSLEETGLPLKSSVFGSFCSAVGAPWLKMVSSMAQMQEFPLMCVSCHSRTLELHDLQEMLNSKQSEAIVFEMVLKMKTDLLLSMPAKPQSTEELRLTVKEVSATDKSEYFRKLIVQDYSPVVPLYDVQKMISSITKTRTRQTRKLRALAENSVFKYVNEDEILILNPDLVYKMIPLSAEELEYYFNCDNGKYACRFCNSQPSTHKGALDHCNRNHRGINRFQCKYCEQQFYQRSDCGNHILLRHKEERADVAAEIRKRLDQSDRIKGKYKDGVIKINSTESDMKFPKEFIRKEGKDKYACNLCPMVGKERCSVKRHLRIVHLGIFRFKCEFCYYKHLQRWSVAKHVQKVHPAKLEKCSSPMQPPSKRIRVEPLSLLEGVIKLQPKLCPKMEDDFTGSGSDFMCKFCGRSFLLRFKVIQHMEKVHFGVRNYQCATCGMKFYCLASCRRHIKENHLNNLQGLNSEIHNSVGIHPEEQKFTPQLEKILQGPVKEEPPGETNLENSPAPVQEYFPSNFEEEYNFENREEIIPISIPMKGELEINEMPFEEMEGDRFLLEKGIETENDSTLNECSELFSQNSEPQCAPIIIYTKTEVEETEEMYSMNSLQNTEGLDDENVPADKAEIYNLIKPGEIIELPKNPNLLRDTNEGHERLPNGYKCLKCEKVLKSRSCLTQHWMIFHDHLGGFQCSVCKKRFNFRWNCAHHFITKHTKRSPLVCPVCERVFSRKRNLERHIQNHTGERPFGCTICNLKFTRESVLRKHYDNVHPNLGPTVNLG